MLTGQKTCAVSVIIPTLNEAARIGRVVTSTAAAKQVEVIVADGGSTDETQAIAAKKGARLVVSSPGRGRQLNAGAAEACGKIFIFLHADSLLPENFAPLTQKTLRSPQVAAGAFRLAIAGQGRGLRFIESAANWRARTLQMPYGDQALFMKAEMFHALGGFRDIPLLEDVDMVSRARKKGTISIVDTPVITSARRWHRLGLVRTTAFNQLILLGYFLGISPFRLALWYNKVRD